MTSVWRIVLFLYSLIIAAAAVLVLIAAIGRTEPLVYITSAVSSADTRLIIAAIAALLLIFTIVTILYSFSSGSAPKTKTVLVNSTIAGDVSMTVPAVKVIIMKAVKKVEGIREVKTTINNKPEGLDVLIQTMINPDHNVPEMSDRIQTTVRQHLEEIGGLKVDSIRVLVDDFGTAAKTPGN